MNTKVKSLILAAVCFLSLTSCESFYSSVSDKTVLNNKNTIQTFDHLNEPIVITLPVYDEMYLFGNSNFSEMTRRMSQIGDPSDITFTWYDVSTEEKGLVKRISISDFWK